MDLSKHLEFFNPTKVDAEIHVIGLGAIGSHVCDMLTRMGIDNMTIYDFDTVDSHNIANQMFLSTQIGQTKTDAIHSTCLAINPEIDIAIKPEGYQKGMRLSGYVFLCVDNIDLRRAIVEEHQYNSAIKAMFDFRMGLEDAQHYAADWTNPAAIKKLLSTMQFSQEEAKEAMPISACGTSLSVIPTVRSIVCLGIANWMNLIKKKEYKTVVLANPFANIIDAF